MLPAETKPELFVSLTYSNPLLILLSFLFLRIVFAESSFVKLSKEFKISKLSDRMGMRLEGIKLKNIVDTNIRSEGLIKGVIQVPADGNPIVMLSDHGTIGGYPKIAVVISADYDKIVQLPPGTKVRFKLIDLKEAENHYKLYSLETENILNQI